MRKIMFLLFFPLSGCATITRGTTDQIQIQSEPSEANAKTSLGHNCVTPCTVTVNKKDEFTVTIEKPGFQSQKISVVTEMGTGGKTALAGNILIGGLIGAGADMTTGAAYDHTPNPVFVTLQPLQKPAAPVSKRRSKRQAPTS